MFGVVVAIMARKKSYETMNLDFKLSMKKKLAENVCVYACVAVAPLDSDLSLLSASSHSPEHEPFSPMQFNLSVLASPSVKCPFLFLICTKIFLFPSFIPPSTLSPIIFIQSYFSTASMFSEKFNGSQIVFTNLIRMQKVH